MKGFRFEGLKQLGRDLSNLSRALEKKTDEALGEQTGKVMEYAKTKRFRAVAGAGAKGGMRKVPPIPGILTVRSNFYRGKRIGPPTRIARGRWELQARVPYADKHEKDRPVLTAALEAKKEEIEKALGLKVYETIERDGWR